MRAPWVGWVCLSLMGCASPRPVAERAPEPARVAAPSEPEPVAAPASAPDAPGAAPAAEPAPSAEIPDPPAGGRPVSVVFEVVRGKTSPLRLRIPSTGTVRTLFDDYVAGPACSVRRDERKNAIFLRCAAADGGLDATAYQSGDELVLDIRSLGDVPPELVGEHRFALPPGSRVAFEAQLPSELRPNPGSGVSGP